MRCELGGLLLSGLVMAALGGTLGCSRSAKAAPTDAAVLVELFTSEGCSSCPPAEAVFRGLPAEIDGARVVVLAHHVDYWDALGWPDPFATAAATARQRAYAPLGGGTYTPQAVVDGRRELVGSRAEELIRHIRSAAHLPHTRVSLTAADPASGPGRAIPITVRAGPLPKDASDDAEVVLAVVQDHGRVAVPRGENAGLTLDHDAIARDLHVLGPAPRIGTTVTTAIAPGAPIAPRGPGSFSVIAFVQERASRKVLGAATLALTR